MKRSRMGKQRSDRFLLARGCGIRRSATSRSGKTLGRDSRAASRFRASPDPQPNRRTNTGLAPSSPPSPAVGHSPFRRRNGVVRNRSTETTDTTIAAKFAHYEGMRCRAQHNPKTPRQLRSALFMETKSVPRSSHRSGEPQWSARSPCKSA